MSGTGAETDGGGTGRREGDQRDQQGKQQEITGDGDYDHVRGNGVGRFLPIPKMLMGY
ncbi:hypothetical protein G3580_10945 [Nitrogeniibacter mangrovi]|uniref:Uncharacterized protein n=1 Tax=Nitrogeniibacter mangrovi TaxID=2016596 RepID=A0A6C1B5X9_9RHOO|nr:hypothetical protein [Nitrogeniibacter mangrovi]QID18108.1 hypothetical protein G3580_10945 [Nitrogeniibacter mangrovi]